MRERMAIAKTGMNSDSSTSHMARAATAMAPTRRGGLFASGNTPNAMNTRPAAAAASTSLAMPNNDFCSGRRVVMWAIEIATAVQRTTQAGDMTVRPTRIPTSGQEMPRQCERIRIRHWVRLPIVIAATMPIATATDGRPVGVAQAVTAANATAKPPETTTRLISSASRLSVTSSLERCCRCTDPLRGERSARADLQSAYCGRGCDASSSAPLVSTHGVLLTP
jgi:hypothetical protein